MVFAGVGFVSLPMDLIREFVGRPRATILRSEYINRAMILSVRATQIKVRSTFHGSRSICLTSQIAVLHQPTTLNQIRCFTMQTPSCSTHMGSVHC